MLQLLLESGARRAPRRTGSTLASVLMHALLVGAAVVVTTRDPMPQRDLVTMRGLRGTAEGSWYFYPLVAVYGIALAPLTRQRPARRSAAVNQSHLPTPFDRE